MTGTGAIASQRGALMRFSETAREILQILHQTHRRPGARMTIPELEARLGTAPAIAVGISELVEAGYLIAPDSRTIELTPRGFDALQDGADRRGETQ
ncbi:hypothetical protein [Microvirga massiliensis]|uniref:hypothetical protein n=1 Tax=Microvirga massiliensis TaxID=1033741 RepID=UPI000ABD80A8|nr:hypothetical protein [Microvirga massiliensis]